MSQPADLSLSSNLLSIQEAKDPAIRSLKPESTRKVNSQRSNRQKSTRRNNDKQYQPSHYASNLEVRTNIKNISRNA